MIKNSGCKDCIRGCKDKSSNAYFYCPRFVADKNKVKDFDVIKDLFGFFNKKG